MLCTILIFSSLRTAPHYVCSAGAFSTRDSSPLCVQCWRFQHQGQLPIMCAVLPLSAPRTAPHYVCNASRFQHHGQLPIMCAMLALSAPRTAPHYVCNASAFSTTDSSPLCVQCWRFQHQGQLPVLCAAYTDSDTSVRLSVLCIMFDRVLRFCFIKYMFIIYGRTRISLLGFLSSHTHCLASDMMM